MLYCIFICGVWLLVIIDNVNVTIVNENKCHDTFTNGVLRAAYDTYGLLRVTNGKINPWRIVRRWLTFTPLFNGSKYMRTVTRLFTDTSEFLRWTTRRWYVRTRKINLWLWSGKKGLNSIVYVIKLEPCCLQF